MPITYWKDKRSPLTIEEMDQNFETLEKRILDLEKHPLAGESIERIEQQSDQIRIVGTYGKTWGPFQLPKFLPRLMGEWGENKEYMYLDIIHHAGKSYICKDNHKSTNFSTQAAHWQLLMGAV